MEGRREISNPPPAEIEYQIKITNDYILMSSNNLFKIIDEILTVYLHHQLEFQSAYRGLKIDLKSLVKKETNPRKTMSSIMSLSQQRFYND